VEIRSSYYPPGNALDVSLTTDCGGWLSYDSATGALSGTPDDPDVGVHWIDFTVTDALGKHCSLNLTLTVVNVNDPPVITTEDATVAEEDSLYSVTYSAADPDPTNDVLIWSMNSNAAWLLLAGSRLYGTPGSKQTGTYWVNVSVEDGQGGADSTNFTLMVRSASGRPRITTVPPTTAIEGVLYFVQFTAADEDSSEQLSWSLYATASWLGINATTGVLAGTPGPNDWGEYCVTVSVTDLKGYADRTSYTLSVLDVDQPPAWASVPDEVNLTEGGTLILNVTATDQDIGDSILYGLTSRPAAGISIDPRSGAVRWPNATAGTYIVSLIATDGNSTITHLFILNVGHPVPGTSPPNGPPVLGPVAGSAATAGRTFILRLNGTDPDSYDAVNLTFHLVSGPAGMALSADGILLWVPGDDQVGLNTVTVALSDGKNTTTSAFTVTVTKSAARTVITNSDGISPAWIIGMLVIGLVAGAAAVYLFTRRQHG